MNSVLRWLFAIGSCAAANSASGCVAPLEPDIRPVEQLAAVFEAEVTGVRLTAYEEYRLREDARKPDDRVVEGEVVEYLYPTSSTPEFDAFVLVRRQFVGTSEKQRVLSLGGCGVDLPDLEQLGLFFVFADPTHGDFTVPVLDSDPDYSHWWAEAERLARGERGEWVRPVRGRADQGWK